MSKKRIDAVLEHRRTCVRCRKYQLIRGSRIVGKRFVCAECVKGNQDEQP